MKKVILLVEDNPEHAEIVQLALSKMTDAEIKWAKDASEALKLLQEGFRPHLILLDYRLPGISGKEFLEKLREMEGVDARVIALTAEYISKAQLIKDGCNNALLKPFLPDELLTKIRRYLNGS